MGGSKEKPVVVWQKKVNWLYITNNGIYESLAGYDNTILIPIVLSPYIAFINTNDGLKGIIATSPLSNKSEVIRMIFYTAKVKYYSNGELAIYV